MRVLISGADGFVGRWLVAELRAHGHVAMAMPGHGDLDIADALAVRAVILSARPELVVHLAAVPSAAEAAADPGRAMRTNVGGTVAVVEAAIETGAAVLAASSSEVYRTDDQAAMPLRESSPLGPGSVYALTKAGAEGVVLGAMRERGLRAVVARAFNHTGPGQGARFAVPAFASRIVEARRLGRSAIRAGNVDVARDLSDVRDVVAAYRLLGELLVGGDREVPAVVNVASGAAVTMREVIGRLAAVAGLVVSVDVDAGLVRPQDPPVIVGDATRLRSLGWRPGIPLEQTLADVLASVESGGHEAPHDRGSGTRVSDR